MYVSKLKLGFVSLVILLLLTACGHPIPTASTDLIKTKKSILILTSPSFNVALESQLTQILNTWKQTELIAYEWVKQVQMVDDLIANKINKTPYSYIIVLSNDLKSSALAIAAQTEDKRWEILSDATRLEANTADIPTNVALYQIDAAIVSAQWNEWVKQQQNQHIQQQQLNVLKGFNSPAGSVSSLTYGGTTMPTIPKVDFQKAGSILLIWDAIWAEQLKVIQLNSFEQGIHYYTSEQIRINH